MDDFILNTRHPAQGQALINRRAEMAIDPAVVAEAIAVAPLSPPRSTSVS